MTEHPTSGLVNLTFLIYGLHLFSVVNAVLGPALIVTAFLTGWPSIIAVVLNYLKRDDARGTHLESHFSWQIRTFWFTVLWMLVAGLLVLTLVGFPFAVGVFGAVSVWVVYRMVRGVWRLMSDKPMPV